MGIVNREIQEDIIKTIEIIFNKYELMPDERIFLIQSLIDRINKTKEQQKIADLMEHQLGSGLLKSIQKRFFKQEEEDKENE